MNSWFLPVLLVFSTISSAHAELSPSEETTAKGVFFEVMSPFCPGRSLNDCPSESANALKSEIRSMVQEGQTKDKIVEALIARYGEEYRAVPDVSGFSGLAWAGPIVFLLLGALIVGIWLRKNSSAT